MATANEASKQASPAIRACYRNGGSCPLSATIAIVDDATGALASPFMTVVGNTLTVTPTTSSHIGSYNMRVTQSTSILPDFSWIGGIVTVTCTITQINVPTVPSVTTYLIGSGAQVITLSPAFTQYPPCDYTLTEFMLWEFNPSPAPVTPDTSNKYQITIDSNDLSKARVQTLTLKNSVTYNTQSFSPEVSFNIEFLHPCRRTTFNSVTLPDITYKLRNG